MKKKKQSGSYLPIILGILVTAIVIFNILQLASLNARIKQQAAERAEAARPADLELILLDPACEACVDVQPVIDLVKRANTRITSERTVAADSAEGKELVKKYSLTAAPSIILLGETEKFSSQEFTERGDGLVFEPSTPPLVDLSTGEVTGLVSATILTDSSCDVCQGLDGVLSRLQQIGVVVSARETVERDSPAGRALIKDYALTKLPALILSKELADYGSAVEKLWLQAGRKAPDGAYVLEQQTPPYVEAATGEIRGLVTMTVITDPACATCYDTEAFNKPILRRFGLVPSETRRVNVSDAKELIDRYAIELVPTFLLSSEATLYSGLVRVWPRVGTVEEDGTYVFRNPAVSRQPYKNLTSGAIINPASQAS
ncbi:hypothetical protein D6789_00500 [Candidatus Woesearchaeota archaeon]|nr:MAG: hypothetical protein D6789_00500 [Candidatus Woesearchaeota archaeon]